MKTLNTFLLSLLLWFSQSVAMASEPNKMVSELSDKVVNALNERRAEFEASPEKVQEFANTEIMPFINTAKMAKYVMARYWKNSSKQQQQGFVTAFSDSLLRTYAVSLLKLKIKEIEIGATIEEKRGKVTVPTKVTQSDGNVTDVSYRAYFSKKQQKWFLYDVSIEGISMLLNYRKTYAHEFKTKGVDKVIKEMQAKNQAYLKG